jgi:hypothetical protein
MLVTVIIAKLTEIERENRILLEKIATIMVNDKVNTIPHTTQDSLMQKSTISTDF